MHAKLTYDTASHDVDLTSQGFWTKHEDMKKESVKELDKVKGERDAHKETYEQHIADIKVEAKTTEDGLHNKIRERDKKYMTCLRLLSTLEASRRHY
jgi:hypothetical protein